jgi:ribose transport system substrate-binding protein
MRRYLIPTIAIVFALIATACSSNSGKGTQLAADANSAGAAQTGKLKIGYIQDNEKVAFAHAVTLSIQKAAKDAGIDLISCDPQEDAAKALQCAITLKQQKVQGLINYQDDQQIAAQLCAQGPQVPVIAISIKQEPCQISFTGADNKAAGSLAGKSIGEYLKANFDCKYDAWISLEAKVTGALNADRLGSYRTGFESVCGKIHDLRVLDVGGQADKAQVMVTDTLTALPNAHRIIAVGINDAVIEGAFAAASAKNRLNDMMGSGQGLDHSGVCAMRKYPKQGLGDTAYFPENYGNVVVPAIIKAAKGESIPAILPAKLGWVTPATVDQYYADVTC